MCTVGHLLRTLEQGWRGGCRRLGWGAVENPPGRMPRSGSAQGALYNPRPGRLAGSWHWSSERRPEGIWWRGDTPGTPQGGSWGVYTPVSFASHTLISGQGLPLASTPEARGKEGPRDRGQLSQLGAGQSGIMSEKQPWESHVYPLLFLRTLSDA